MRKIITTLVAGALLYGTLALGTYPGSIVSSFFAEPLEEEGIRYFPLGITYGDRYMWVVYAHDVVTKRRPDNGSVVASFHLASWGWQLAWEESHKYLYDINWFGYVCWSNSATGSTIGSFPKPGTAALYGIDYDDGAPSRPIWVAQNYPHVAWNLTTTGSVVSSFSLSSWPYTISALAYDGDTPGGDYLFFGMRSAPPYIFVVNANTFSLISSFVAPTADLAICDLSWDGRYLWALENGPPPAEAGWVYRFVAHSSPKVEPASFGKIKAVFR
jgi:hypothetical protein